ncbi:hypothetical protein GGF32_006769, partial [Allomyces javanicus]
MSKLLQELFATWRSATVDWHHELYLINGSIAGLNTETKLPSITARGQWCINGNQFHLRLVERTLACFNHHVSPTWKIHYLLNVYK